MSHPRSSSRRSQLLPGIVAAVVATAALHWIDRPAPADDGAPELAAAVARIERRLGDVEHQVEIALQPRAQPAMVTRVAEERGVGVDAAWNEYFDSIVTRLDRLEQRLDGGEEPLLAVNSGFVQLANGASLIRSADGNAVTLVSRGNGTFESLSMLWAADQDPQGNVDLYLPSVRSAFFQGASARRGALLRNLAQQPQATNGDPPPEEGATEAPPPEDEQAPAGDQ